MARVFVAGHKGMVGSAICRLLAVTSDHELVTADRLELDLCNQAAVYKFFENNSIDYVYLAAAKVGGIHANSTLPAEFLFENLMIQTNVIHSAFKADVKRLLFLGSSCIYPKFANQPIREEELLTGALEHTNEPYAIAKIAGIKLCQAYNKQFDTDFRCVMPTNLYGPGDNFHPDNSHVLPALMRRFHLAKQNHSSTVEVWGSGQARREFLHVDDMARACIYVLDMPRSRYHSITSEIRSHLNVGTGKDISIGDLAHAVAGTVGYSGNIIFDRSRPDGTPKKLLDVSVMKELGWEAQIDLSEGLNSTYGWFINNAVNLRGV